jgi:hypothetical protein
VFHTIHCCEISIFSFKFFEIFSSNCSFPSQFFLSNFQSSHEWNQRTWQSNPSNCSPRWWWLSIRFRMCDTPQNELSQCFENCSSNNQTIQILWIETQGYQR